MCSRSSASTWQPKSDFGGKEAIVGCAFTAQHPKTAGPSRQPADTGSGRLEQRLHQTCATGQVAGPDDGRDGAERHVLTAPARTRKPDGGNTGLWHGTEKARGARRLAGQGGNSTTKGESQGPFSAPTGTDMRMRPQPPSRRWSSPPSGWRRVRSRPRSRGSAGRPPDPGRSGTGPPRSRARRRSMTAWPRGAGRRGNRIPERRRPARRR